ncbi:unnamed protein product, partial [Urochloa humidicola]
PGAALVSSFASFVFANRQDAGRRGLVGGGCLVGTLDADPRDPP